ncbi:hypothetical protein AAC387_Pa07g1904 [Persea americana]
MRCGGGLIPGCNNSAGTAPDQVLLGYTQPLPIAQATAPDQVLLGYTQPLPIAQATAHQIAGPRVSAERAELRPHQDVSNNQSRPGHAAQDVTLTNTTAARGSSTAAPQQSQALGSHDFALQITPIQAGSHLFTAEQVCPYSPNSPAGPLHIGPNAPNASAPLLTSSMDITNQTLVGSCMLPPPSGVPKATIAPTHSTVPTHGNSGAGLVDLTNFGSTSSLEVRNQTTLTLGLLDPLAKVARGLGQAKLQPSMAEFQVDINGLV